MLPDAVKIGEDFGYLPHGSGTGWFMVTTCVIDQLHNNLNSTWPDDNISSVEASRYSPC
jgi:hypothetical protein